MAKGSLPWLGSNAALMQKRLLTDVREKVKVLLVLYDGEFNPIRELARSIVALVEVIVAVG